MENINMLIDPLPSTVTVGGREIPIESNFRTSILFELMIQSHDLDNAQKSITAMELYYPREHHAHIIERNETIDEAIDRIVWFYCCGKQRKIAGEQRKENAKIERREHDFDVDAPLIYAAFLSQYGIDLNQIEYLHWWSFCAMFRGLSDEHQITKIMGYRTVDLSSIKNKAEKSRLAKLQSRYALPFTGTIQDMERAAGSLFGGMNRR